MKTKLTKRQEEVYDYIVSHIKSEFRPPTIRQIGSELGITSTNGVYCHLKSLRKKGYLHEGRYLKPIGIEHVYIETEKVIIVEHASTIKHKVVTTEKPTILISTQVNLDVLSLSKAQKMCVLLSELQNSHRIYKHELEKRYGLDDRTVRRWLSDLSEIGVNINRDKCEETNKTYFKIVVKF